MLINTKIPLSYVLGRIKYKILIVIILAIAMGFGGDLIDKYAVIQHPIGIPAFVGTALVFILAFRTNQAYDRWWEARKVWGAIVNDNRSLSRLILTFISEDEKELKERMIMRQVGWNHILVKRLRKLPISETQLQYFDTNEQVKIKNAVNANQVILKLQSEDLKKVLFSNKLDIIHHIEIEKILTALEASLGKTERIKSTKFPVLYDLLIVISIYVFSGLLALAIVDSAHFFEVIFTTVISTIFLSLEQISVDMQDPFEDLPSDIPISSISYSIERGLLQLIEKNALSEPPVGGKFWVK